MSVCVCVYVCVCMPSMFPNISGTFCTLSVAFGIFTADSPVVLAPWFQGCFLAPPYPQGCLMGGASPAKAPCLEAGSSSGRPEVTLQGWPSHPRSLLLAHKFGGPPVSHSLWPFQVRTQGIRQITPQGDAANRKTQSQSSPWLRS